MPVLQDGNGSKKCVYNHIANIQERVACHIPDVQTNPELHQLVTKLYTASSYHHLCASHCGSFFFMYQFCILADYVCLVFV